MAPVPAAPRVPRPILLFVAAKENGSACSVHGGNGLPHPILIFVTAKKNGPPATTSLLHGRTARLQHRCEAQAGTGCHEGGIILSKKPPEWRLSSPLHVVSHGRNAPAAPRGQPRAECPRCSTSSASDSVIRCRKGKWPACSGRSGNGLPRPILITLQQRRTACRLQHRCCTEERPAGRMTFVDAGGDRMPRRRHKPK